MVVQNTNYHWGIISGLFDVVWFLPSALSPLHPSLGLSLKSSCIHYVLTNVQISSIHMMSKFKRPFFPSDVPWVGFKSTHLFFFGSLLKQISQRPISLVLTVLIRRSSYASTKPSQKSLRLWKQSMSTCRNRLLVSSPPHLAESAYASGMTTGWFRRK